MRPPSETEQDVLLAAIRECVTVVKPGEVLVVRAKESWTPRQVFEVQRAVDEMIKWRELGIAALIVPGDEFVVAQKDADAAFAERVVAAINSTFVYASNGYVSARVQR